MMVFSFIFIPGFKVSATQTVDGQFIYGDSYQYVSATDYDFSNFNFTYNNITYTKDYLYEIIENYLNDNNYTIDDFTYIFISTPKNVIISDDTMNSIQIELFSDEIAPANDVCFHFSGYDSQSRFLKYQSSDKSWQGAAASKYAHLKINLSDNSVSTITHQYPQYLPYYSFAVRSMYSNKSYNIYSNYVSNTFLVSKQYDFKIYSTFYYDENLINFKPKSYTFNEDIVVTDISKIKVKFKLPSNTSNLAIDFKYKISQLGFGVGTLGDPYVSLKSIENNIEKTSINSFKSYRNQDHLIEEMKNCVSNYYNSIGATHDGSKRFDTLISKLNSISRYDDHKNLEIESAIKSVFVEDDELFVTLYPLALRYVDQDYCSGTYVVSLLPDSTVYEYTFEVDVYNYEGSINLNFTSNLNYEIDYEYKSDLNNFLTTINMDNYSALILIPKVKNLETGSLSSISSDVYLSGIYDINLLEDIDSKNVLYHHNDYDYSVFSHYQDYHYLNATLLFVKKSFGSVNNTITFDSRYYSYVTKFNLSDEVTINNPNTGEDIIIGDISDFYDYGLDNKKFTFNSFLKPIKFVFESITNFYKNYCPELVQNFFYLIFVFFVVLVLIRIFL